MFSFLNRARSTLRLYWAFYAVLLSQIVTGCLHYFG